MSYNAQFVEALKKALNGLRTIHSVGEEWCSYIGKIPVGGVPYCGQEVTRSTYSALWSYAQAQGLVKSESEWQSIASAQGGNVPFYSSGDGSSTFRMPRLVGYVRGASGQSEAGEYIAEGLPDHSHQTPYGKNDTGNTHAEGTISPHISTNEKYITIYGYSKDSTLASASNPIYGNSNHVTPETSVVLFGVYAFGEVGNVDALDAGTLARIESNLDLKLSEADKAKIVSWCPPDYSAGVAISTSVSTFTAPTDGLFVWNFSMYEHSASGFVTINGAKAARFEGWTGGWAGVTHSIELLVAKGDVIAGLLTSTTNISEQVRTFFPLKGAQ